MGSRPVGEKNGDAGASWRVLSIVDNYLIIPFLRNLSNYRYPAEIDQSEEVSTSLSVKSFYKGLSPLQGKERVSKESRVSLLWEKYAYLER